MKPIKDKYLNIALDFVYLYEDGILKKKEDQLIKECITKISINKRNIEILPAVDEHIDLLGMGYLYQITELDNNTLASGEIYGSDYNITVKQFNSWSCMCKKIFFNEKKLKLLEKSSVELDKDIVFKVFNDFNQASENFRRTGALHGAALYKSNGERISFFEDIARTNVIYKTTGYLIKNKITEQAVIVLSCRVNTIILNLLLNVGFTAIITRASVTHEAFEKANKMGIILIGFIKENRYTIFSGRDKISF